MKIAVVMFGQPRFFKNSYKRILQEFTFPGHQVDFFCHFWDQTNHSVEDDLNGKFKDTKKLTEFLLEDFEPKKCTIESQDETKEFSRRCAQLFNMFDKRGLVENKNKTVIEMHSEIGPLAIFGQFESIRRGILLKQQYEKENNFKYDLVIRVRTDLWFVNPEFYLNEDHYNEDKEAFYLRQKQFVERYPRVIWGDGLQMWRDSNWDGANFKPDSTKALTFIDPHEKNILMQTHPTKTAIGFENSLPDRYSIHLKDWVIWGTSEGIDKHSTILTETFLIECMTDIRKMIEDKPLNNWGAGELVNGRSLLISKTRAQRPLLSWPNQVRVWTRFNKLCDPTNHKMPICMQDDKPPKGFTPIRPGQSTIDIDKYFYKNSLFQKERENLEANTI